jgi:hypothetical protein
LSLAALGWDVASRTARIERLKGQGVDVSTFKPDLWEEIVRGEPYFFATYIGPIRWSGAGLTRGGLPASAQDAQQQGDRQGRLADRQAVTEKRRMRASIARLFCCRPRKPTSTSRLESINAWLTEIRRCELGERFLIPSWPSTTGNSSLSQSLYGWDEKFIWRTFDFATDATGDKSVIETLAGKVKHDGREIIFTLPNGLHGYYLSTVLGAQVLSFRKTSLSIRDRER